MGAWGTGSFENDDAGDWVWTLEDDRDGSVLDAAFEVVTDAGPNDYVERPDAANAIAAAEIVAASIAEDSSRLPEEGRAWVASNASLVGPDVVEQARRAVERARDSSELRELWDEAGPQEWLAGVNDLLARLTAVRP